MATKYNSKGEEIGPFEPVVLPVEFKRPISLEDQIRMYVRGERLAQAMEESGNETFDEADDFDIPDDPINPTTPWEDRFDPLAPGVAAREQEIRAGFVNDRTPEEKENARETLRRAREGSVRGRRTGDRRSKVKARAVKGSSDRDDSGPEDSEGE